MIILEKGQKADTLYGMDIEYITDEQVQALIEGKRLYTNFNGEYALTLKYKEKKQKNNFLNVNKEYLEGYIQGEYNPQKKINEVLRFIDENKEIWEDNEIIQELLKNIELILK